MGLLDKVKAQATVATGMAKDAAAKGQAKIDEAQAKKNAEGMLRDLGAAFYATKTGRATPTTDGGHRPPGHRPRRVRVRARADDAGAGVRGGRPDGGAGRGRRRCACPTPAAPGGGPGVAPATTADGADALGLHLGPRGGRGRPAGR